MFILTPIYTIFIVIMTAIEMSHKLHVLSFSLFSFLPSPTLCSLYPDPRPDASEWQPDPRHHGIVFLHQMNLFHLTPHEMQCASTRHMWLHLPSLMMSVWPLSGEETLEKLSLKRKGERFCQRPER
ncbi:hypothetical protein DPSP01_008661 [Paraphaeosphaeria sporulosa]